MSKKKKDGKKKRQPSPPISISPLNNNISKKADDVAGDAPKEIEAENQPKIEAIQANATALDASKDIVSEADKNTLNELFADLKNAIAAYKQAKGFFEGKNLELEKRSDVLDNKEIELDGRKESLDFRETSLSDREKSLVDREKDLNEREKFVGDKEISVETREADIAKREAEADAGFLAKEAAWKKNATDKLNEELKIVRDDLKSKRDQYNADHDQLVKDQEKCRLEKGSYESKQAALKETEERLKKEHEEAIADLRAEYDRILGSYEADYKKQYDRLDARNSDLQNQISTFNDIRAELDGHSTSEIKKIISSLKGEVARLKLEIQNVGSAEFQQSLEEQVQQYKDECETLTAEKNELDAKLLKLRKQVFDVDGLKALNKTLETHNKALAEAQNQLQNKLDELTSKDNNKDIFAEFRGIDARCSIPYNGFTQSDGNLKTFVNAIGYQLTQYTPNLFYTPQTLQLFVGGLAMSRLILLQGISGTGKTKLAQAFSSIVGDNLDGSKTSNEQERCSCIIPVQAGWRDNQDLLGYYNAFEKKFYERPFSKGLYAASTPAFKNRLFFLILDEMNLSHPEQYFADFISAMEQANSVSDSFEVDLLSGIPTEIMEDKKRWPLYLNKERIVIPSNVWFIGTANHDETTMEFADKTYDRAHVMVMDRNTQKPNYACVEKGAAHWAASDLRDAFKEAQVSSDGKSNADWVKKQLDTLKDVLKKEFDVSFGNRLERQIDNFVPVVCAAGGTKKLALDHLIATKIIRRGKITGLFGVQKESLEALRGEILTGIGLKDDSQTIKLLEQDIAAKERGA